MKNLTNNSTLFITSAMAVTIATSSLVLITFVGLLRVFEMSSAWSNDFDRHFDDTTVAVFAGTLLFFIVSVVRCFSNDKSIAAFASLMFVVGFLYLIVLSVLGTIVFGVLHAALGVGIPYWSIFPCGFAFFLMLRMALNYRRRSKEALAAPVVTVVRLNVDG